MKKQHLIEALLLKSSRCMTMVVTSSDLDFLSNFTEDAIKNNLLIWPTRLLVVTNFSTQLLRRFQKSLSAINAIVLILEKTSIPARLEEGADLLLIGQNLPPHLIVKKRITQETGIVKDDYNGPIMMVLEILANHVNFTYKIIPPQDGKWGYLLPNGTWDGMIGMLVKKQADFAISPLAVTYLRSQAIDFTKPLYVDYGRILGRRGNTEVNPWSFVWPLTASVWLATIVTLLVIVVVVTALSAIQWNTPSLSPKLNVATYLRTFFQQNIEASAENTWETLFLGIWMIGVFVIIKCYSTNLTSLLAVRYISEPYQTLKDMVSDPRVISIWFQNTAYIQYMTAVKSGIFYEVAQTGAKGRIKQIEPNDYTKIVNDLVSRGDHVMVNPLLMMKMFLTEDYMENGNCKFYVSKEMFLPFTFCMILQKNSPLTEAINQGIRAVVEGGLYDYWLDKSFANAKSCKNPPTTITDKTHLSLANTWGMFVVLLFGYMVSLSALLMEIVAFSFFKASSSSCRIKS